MLSTTKTLLRPPTIEDKDFLVDLRNNIDLQLMLMSRPRANTSSKVDSWLHQKTSDEHTVFFVISDANDGFPVGYIQLVEMDFINRKSSLGVCIDTQYHGRGYAKDAFQMLEVYAKKIFNIHKIIVSVLVQNKRAVSFYDKMSYRSVGILEADFYLDGEFHDVLLMEKII